MKRKIHLIKDNTEGDIYWKLEEDTKYCYITVEKGIRRLSEQYQWQYKPIWGHDTSDINIVNEILDRLIEIIKKEI